MGSYRCALILVLAATTFAQDRRTVTEPAFPKTCAVLQAELSAVENNRTVAEADESKLDTARIQKAIDACPKGQAVELRPTIGHNAFLSGPLDLRAGVTLRVAQGAILFGSRAASVYEKSPGSCGIVNESGRGCRALINVDGVAGAAVMGEGTIDGRGWAKLLGKSDSWWELAEQARKGGNQNCPRLIVTNRSDDFTLYKITLKNSANFHVVFGAGSGFTAWGVIIDTPKNARNTDGIDPSGANNVTITRCFIHTGDDNVAIKAGAHVSHMTIAHNHFYTGHGMSIGSETNGGAEAIRVIDLSIDGADNGIRIKSNSSRGGLVKDVVYEDVCIRDTKNPILMDSNYTFTGKARDLLPHFTGITLRNVRVLSGGKITLEGFDATHKLGMTFDNVMLDDPSHTKVAASHAELTYGPGPVNFQAAGEDVKIAGSSGKGDANACREKFVAMPK
jgi:polygalacturonase